MDRDLLGFPVNLQRKHGKQLCVDTLLEVMRNYVQTEWFHINDLPKQVTRSFYWRMNKISTQSSTSLVVKDSAPRRDTSDKRDTSVDSGSDCNTSKRKRISNSGIDKVKSKPQVTADTAAEVESQQKHTTPDKCLARTEITARTPQSANVIRVNKNVNRSTSTEVTKLINKYSGKIIGQAADSEFIYQDSHQAVVEDTFCVQNIEREATFADFNHRDAFQHLCAPYQGVIWENWIELAYAMSKAIITSKAPKFDVFVRRTVDYKGSVKLKFLFTNAGVCNIKN